MIKLESVNQDEVYRYLGYSSRPADENIRNKISSYTNLLLGECTPKYVFAKHEIACENGLFTIARMNFKSDDFYAHVEGCKNVIILAATLGIKVDRLLKRLEVTDITGAVIVQAAAAAAIEKVCDEAEKEISEALNEGDFLIPRFSPGYGDLPITLQPKLLSLLDAPKKIGLSCTETYMLTPIKSVTAFIGISENEVRCNSSKCKSCPNLECTFRKKY